MAEKIIKANIVQDYRDCKSAYGMYVNTVRAVPSLRDGLKKVTRRAMYSAFELKAYENHIDINDNKITNGRGNFKTARVIGDTIGKYHPHGDSSVKGNIKKMTNDFELNYPYFKGEGNWGNAFGDGEAAERYTETQLSKFSLDCIIGDLIRCPVVVDWSDNFDYKEKEPDYFPIKFATLLVNGSFGIGVGIQCSIPGHNLNEVIDAHLRLFDNPNAEVVLVPEHAMGCDIVDTNWKAICNKGYGKYIARAVVDIEEVEGCTCLVVKSLPDLTFMESIQEKIIQLMKEKKLTGITDLRYCKSNPGEKEVFRYVIELKKGTDPNYIREFLYKNTSLQKTCLVSFEVLDDTDPSSIKRVRLSYQAYIQFVNQQLELNKFRLYNYHIRRINTKYHTREAFIKILKSGNFDKILDIIRKADTVSDAEINDKIVKSAGITPLQATYIMEIPAKKLSKGYLKSFIEKNKDLEAQLNYFESRIMNNDLLIQDIKEELLAIKKRYGRPRKSRIIKESEVNGIPEGEFNLIVTNTNFVKKVGLNDGFGGIKGDMIKTIMRVDNTKSVLLFDEQGKVFNLPVHKLPLGDRSTPPIDIRTILKNATSNITTIIYEPLLTKVSKLRAYHFLTIMSTRTIKKLDIADFLSVTQSGLKYTSLGDGDKVVDVSIVADGLDVLVYSRNKALRMNIAEIPHQKRVNVGMKIMDTQEPVEGLSVLSPTMTHIVVLTEKGKVNKVNILALPLSSRGKAGSKVINLAKGDSIRDIHGMNEEDTLQIVTKNETYELKLANIPEGSSISKGTQMIKILQGDSIIRCNLI